MVVGFIPSGKLAQVSNSNFKFPFKNRLTISLYHFASLIIIFHKKQRDYNQFITWIKMDFLQPSPYVIKLATLKRYGASNDAWVETGTFRGQTTRNLASMGKFVVSIEPSEYLYNEARLELRDCGNVELLHGTSEEKLETAIQEVKSKGYSSLSLWLDGHYSDGPTYKGEKDSPIVYELHVVERALSYFDNLTVLVDDVRCFDPENPIFSDYPTINYLVDWATRLNLKWTIEFDIFIARKISSTISLQSNNL
jgi:hypothetical protein